MNAKKLFALLTLLVFVAPLRADGPTAPPVEQMIAELKQIAELVKQLDDNRFDKRQDASERLVRMGKPAVEPLQRILAAKPSLEMTNRIKSILRDLRKKNRPRNKVHEQLAQRINLEKGIEGNTPLKDALEFLSDRYDLTILVDSRAFETIGVQKVEEQPISLPRMSNVPLRTVFFLLLKQIRGDDHHGTFSIRGDRIAVTTTLHANPQTWAGDNRLHAARVDADFDGQELEDALQALSDSTGISVVLDGRVADKASQPVKARLNNVPLDTAVRLLTDMAGLKVVTVPNALYVTSRENAKEMETEKEERIRRERRRAQEAEKKLADAAKGK